MRRWSLTPVSTRRFVRLVKLWSLIPVDVPAFDPTASPREQDVSRWLKELSESPGITDVRLYLSRIGDRWVSYREPSGILCIGSIEPYIEAARAERALSKPGRREDARADGLRRFLSSRRADRLG